MGGDVVETKEFSMELMLAGLILPNVQNHSLGRLAAATRAGGFTAEVVPFRGFTDIDQVTAAVSKASPRVFGVSLQTTESALASVVLVEMLRRRGFIGVIVAGGHFATLNAEELMREVGALDVVIRFAGEAALLSLLAQGVAPHALAAMPGAVYRGADGTVKLGAPPMVDPPLRAAGGDFGEALPVHLGFPAADIVASRGCEAHCAYCCVAGASDLAAAHGARYARTAETALAQVIGALYHDRGARVFNFMDDNLLPMVPDQAVAWLAGLSAALRARAVGRIAFSLQLRADVCTPEVVARLVDIGLCRAYVGIDGYSGRQLTALGRDAPSDAGVLALGRLASAGVFSVCNALIIGPTFAFSSILREIEALAEVRDAPVHLLPIDVRAGSKYFERVRSRGLLEGGLLWRRYRFADPRTARLAEAITAFPTRLEEHSVPIALYDLGYNLGIARRLVPEAATDELVLAYRSVTERWNADQLRVLRGAAAAAEASDPRAVARFVEEERGRVRALDTELRAACAGALRAVERAVSRARRSQVRVHTRGQLLSTVALSMALAACSSQQRLEPRDGAAEPPALDAAVPGIDAGIVVDLGPGLASCGDGGPVTGPPATSLPASVCFCGIPGSVDVTFDSAGMPIEVTLSDGGAVPDTVRACVLRAIGSYCYPSLAGTSQPIAAGHCWIA
jgi:hypothetical protein